MKQTKRLVGFRMNRASSTVYSWRRISIKLRISMRLISSALTFMTIEFLSVSPTYYTMRRRLELVRVNSLFDFFWRATSDIYFMNSGL